MFPILTHDRKTLITNLVNEILAAKGADPGQTPLTLKMRLIDWYTIYTNLTDDEIAIVEGSV